MAGDWLKIEKITPEKPEIIRMASILKMDSDAIFGKIFKIWTWADDQSVDGICMDISETFLDQKAAKRGFAKAMRAVGWLAGDDGSLVFPGFERHNGTTAKARAESNRRMAKSRITLRECCGNVAGKPQQKPQPEKRREELIPPNPLAGGTKGGGDDPIPKIKNLRKRWGTGPALDAKEARIYRKNAVGWESYTGEDWAVVGEFMRASLPDGSSYFQPEKLAKALELPTSLLADARHWKGRQRPKVPSNVLPMPHDAEETLTKAEAAEFVRKAKP